jgi:hypothetical protein
MDPTTTPRRPRSTEAVGSVAFDTMTVSQNSSSRVEETNHLQPQQSCSTGWCQCCTGWRGHCRQCGEGRWQLQRRGEPTQRQRMHERTCWICEGWLSRRAKDCSTVGSAWNWVVFYNHSECPDYYLNRSLDVELGSKLSAHDPINSRQRKSDIGAVKNINIIANAVIEVPPVGLVVSYTVIGLGGRPPLPQGRGTPQPTLDGLSKSPPFHSHSR